MEIVFLSVVVFIASAIGTLTGFGVSTVMLPVAMLFYPYQEALMFVGIIHWFGNIWKLVLFRQSIQWKLILCFGIPGIGASYLGATHIVWLYNYAIGSSASVYRCDK